MLLLDNHPQTQIPPFVATIGFFDGVHKGHLYLLAKVLAHGKAHGLTPAVVTFRTHPLKVLRPQVSVPLLSTPEEKLFLLQKAGIEACIMLDFTPQLSRLDARQFMQLLKQQYHVQSLIMGHDHRFGHNARIEQPDYVHIGSQEGIKVWREDEFVSRHRPPGESVNSSAIRQLLQEGRVAEANSLLGYEYQLQGTVVHGEAIGRQIGFPTANLKLSNPDKLLPADGVYAVRATVKGHTHHAMLSIGNRPTFGSEKPKAIETYIHHFYDDIYGEKLTLHLVQRLRRQLKFCKVEELVQQMEQDRLHSLQILQQHPPTAITPNSHRQPLPPSSGSSR